MGSGDGARITRMRCSRPTGRARTAPQLAAALALRRPDRASGGEPDLDPPSPHDEDTEELRRKALMMTDGWYKISECVPCYQGRISSRMVRDSAPPITVSGRDGRFK